MVHRLARSKVYLLLVLVHLFIFWPSSSGATWASATEEAPIAVVADAGTWTPTGTMTTPRGGLTLTLLPNGQVLAAGGVDQSSIPQATAELYDPATGVWTNTGTMATSRGYHSATLLPNGKVLVVGGADSAVNAIASAELYDPATQTWTPTGSLHTPRGSHGAVLLSNGKVLVIGGWANSQAHAIESAEIYDPATGLWTETGDLNIPRAGPAPALLPDGRVLVVGGTECCPYTSVPGAEIFDPDTNAWALAAPMSAPRADSSAILLSSGQVLVAGGEPGFGQGGRATAELYDPGTNTWIQTGDLITGRGSHTAVLLSTGDVLVAGGSGEHFEALASAEVYDTESGTWSAAGTMHTARKAAHAAVLLPTGQVLVAGGTLWPGPDGLAAAELYTPAQAPLPALGNLLANPGFEFDANGDTRPDDWTSNPVVTRSQDQVHRGSYAMRHSVDLDSSYTIQQTVSEIQPGSPYALSGWANVLPLNNANGFTLTMMVEWRDATDAITGTTALLPITQTTQGWMIQEGVVTSPIGASSAAVQIDLQGLNGTLYVDDLYFGNSVSNAGFELDNDADDRADGWQPEDLALRTEQDVQGGSYALHLQGTNNATYDLASTPLVDIVAGKLYRVSASVKIPAGKDAFRFDIVIEWQDALGGANGATLVRRYKAANGGIWTAMNETIAAPASSRQAVLSLVVTSLTGSIYIDDLAIYPYEPSAGTHIPLIVR